MLTGAELQAMSARQFADAPAFDVFQFQQRQPLFFAQPGFAVQRALGVGQGNHFAAEIHDLTRRVLRDVAGSGNRHALAFHGLPAALEHFFGEVHASEPGGFRANQAAAVGHAFAGEDAGELVAQAFVLTEEEANFPRTDADIAGRHVYVGADVAVQLAHERLTETHDFGIALALRIEVRAALAAAHGQGGQRVLEGLLEGEEFQHAHVHRWMKTQTALVWADGAVHLDAETAIDLNLALIVDPRHAKHYGALRLADTLQNPRGQVMRIGFEKRPQTAQHLFDSLVKFGLVRVAFFQARKEGFDGFDHGQSLGKFIVVGGDWAGL